jgi:hypothetical protein
VSAPTSAPLTEQTVFLAMASSERLTHQVLMFKVGAVPEITRRPHKFGFGGVGGRATRVVAHAVRCTLSSRERVSDPGGAI